MPDGHAASSRVASQRIAMAAVPYSIGHPASAAVVTGRVNERGGYMDWRPARSPEKPNVNTARKKVKVAVIGTTTTKAKLSGVSRLTRRPDARISTLTIARAVR